MLSLVVRRVGYIISLVILGIAMGVSAAICADDSNSQSSGVKIQSGDIKGLKTNLKPSEIYDMKLSRHSNAASEYRADDKMRPSYEYKKAPYRNWENFSTPNAGMYQQMESYNASLNSNFMSNDKNLKASFGVPLKNNNQKN